MSGRLTIRAALLVAALTALLGCRGLEPGRSGPPPAQYEMPERGGGDHGGGGMM